MDDDQRGKVKFSSAWSDDSFSIPEIAEDVIDFNERLRHQMPTFAPPPEQHMSRIMAGVSEVIVRQAFEEVVMLRQMNGMSLVPVDLYYVPLTEKYKTVERDVESVLDSSEKALIFKKFEKDLSWLEMVLEEMMFNLDRSFDFDDLLRIVRDVKSMKEEEKSLLGAKEFNRSELIKLRRYIDVERVEMMKANQKITEEVGNFKDELNDNITELGVKMRYIMDWQEARNEQNQMILRGQEDSLKRTMQKMAIEKEKEARIHEEVIVFLQESITEAHDDIEKWLDKYDVDMEDKEQEVQTIRIQLEQQRDEHTKLQEEFDRRQRFIEDFRAAKIRKKAEAEELRRRAAAATTIQSWWRGVMFRKGLGPFRRKKGKGKRGGSAKNSKKK